jgi:hypothetical protein
MQRFAHANGKKEMTKPKEKVETRWFRMTPGIQTPLVVDAGYMKRDDAVKSGTCESVLRIDFKRKDTGWTLQAWKVEAP